MTVLYEFFELEEQSSPRLKIWKVWHIIIYALIAVFGVINYTFLENTKQFVDGHCVLYPHELAFHMVEIESLYEKRKLGSFSNATIGNETNVPIDNNKLETENTTEGKAQENNGTNVPVSSLAQEAQVINATTQADAQINKEINATADTTKREKRYVVYRNDTKDYETTIEVDNVTVLIENKTHRLMLDNIRTFFLDDKDCQYAEFTPLLSTIFAMVWMVLYMMCPGEGRQLSGLQQPWRILAPALIFAMILFCVTARSFAQTNGGIQAFCAEFYNYTDTTACSAVDRYLVSNSSWSFGVTAALTRAGSGGVWAGWACACAVMLARCVLAPDFAVKRTAVVLTNDPQKKLTPYLKKSPQKSRRRSPPSPTAPSPLPTADDASVKSEPTFTSQVVTATVEKNDDAEESIEMKSVLPREKEVV